MEGLREGAPSLCRLVLQLARETLAALAWPGQLGELVERSRRLN